MEPVLLVFNPSSEIQTGKPEKKHDSDYPKWWNCRRPVDNYSKIFIHDLFRFIALKQLDVTFGCIILCGETIYY